MRSRILLRWELTHDTLFDHMEDTETIQRDGIRWIIGAGAFAVFLAAGLWLVDDFLSTSSYNKDVYNALVELRTAQSSLSTMPSDGRQLENP